MWAGFWGWLALPPMERHPQDGRPPPLKARWRALLRAELRLAGALGLGAALAAVQLLPTAEYLLQSQRASTLGFEFALNYSTWPWHFLNLLAPDLFGNPVHGDYWGYANYWEDAMYIGLLPFLLALSVVLRQAVHALRRLSLKRNPAYASGIVARGFVRDSNRYAGERDLRLEKLSWFLIALIAVTVVLSLGKNTPLYPWLFANVPTFDMFQAPARYLIWLEFALVLLAGMGMDRWRRPSGKALYWTRLATAGAFAVSVGAGLAWYLMGDIRPTFIQATALAGFWGLIAGVLSLSAPPAIVDELEGKKRPREDVHTSSRLRINPALWGYAVLVFVAVDLIVSGWGLNPGGDLNLYDGKKIPTTDPIELANRQRLYLPPVEEQMLKFERFFLFDTFEAQQDWQDLKTVLLPNMNLLYGIASVNNFDPLVSGRYAHWMETLESVQNKTKQRMMNLMGVGVVERVKMGAAANVSFESRPGDKLARARWVPCAIFAQDGEAALNQVLLSSQEDQVVIEGPVPENRQACPATAGGIVHVVSEMPNQLLIRASAPMDGWLVVSDVWYPGWHAQVDQHDAPVRRADYLFRAVELPQGDHEIVFSYRPVSFWAGLILSLSAIMGIGLVSALKIGRISSN
jgi:hypothetical protein